MFKRLIHGALIFGMMATAPPAVWAQANCAARDQVVTRLSGQFSETLNGVGLQSPVRLIEVWTSAKTGSWTIMSTQPDGLSCILAHGLNWQDAVTPPAELGTAATYR